MPPNRRARLLLKVIMRKNVKTLIRINQEIINTLEAKGKVIILKTIVVVKIIIIIITGSQFIILYYIYFY